MFSYLIYLLKTRGAYNRNIHIFATVELSNKDPTLTLHRQFLDFNPMYMNITDY